MRWVACLAIVIALHGGIVVSLLSHRTRDADPLPPAPEAILLDLPAEISPPPHAQSELRAQAMEPPPEPEPEPPRAERPAAPSVARPVLAPEPAMPAPAVAAEVALPVLPPAPPPPRQVAPWTQIPRPSVQRRTAPAPEQAIAAPAQAVAPAPAAALPPAPASNAVPNWRSELIGKLLRAKRYPEGARARGEQGTALTTFTLDRGGHVLLASVTRGSGSYQLDEEAVAVIHRAAPLPALPAEVPGSTITLTVPIAFTLR